MIKIAVCDDDIIMLQMIYEKLEGMLKNKVIYECYRTVSVKDLMVYCTNTYVNILVIDIEMPEKTGFEFVKWFTEYNKKAIIIFVTNIELYVYESFKYNAYRFIRKSHLDEFDEAVSSAVDLVNKRTEKFSVQVSPKLSYEVVIEDIVYFESQHNNLRIVTIHGENVFRSTLKDVEITLKKRAFVRIHSGILLNIKYVYRIDTKKFEVVILFNDNKTCLPISRSNLKKLVDEYKIYLR